MKKFICLFFLFACSLFFAQSFPYTRSWGTYVGGGGTTIYPDNGYKNIMMVDSQNNVFLNAFVANQNSVYPATYYDQFAISAGGYPFVNNDSNFFLTEFSTNGAQLYGAYKGGRQGAFERLIAMDAQNNRYIVKVQSGFVSNLATAGAWLTDYTNTYTGGNVAKTYTLSKYDSSGNIIYTTYLPNTIAFQSYVDGDSIYLIGTTRQEIPGLSNPGVFQEHYINYIVGSSGYDNGYYIKLNGNGNKQIGSYFPTNIDARLYNGGLYFFTDISGLPANVQQSLVTPGTFQQSGGRQVLCKFNANTGTLVWGTALGVNASNTYITGVYTFNINETGVYLYGNAESPVGNYYATAGAFKTQITGDSDVFLTKFNDTGNRVWGTYLGGDGMEDNFNHEAFALRGNKIVVGGTQYGTDNISTTGAFLTTVPNPSGASVFFAGFDADGNQEFCSYYGGVITSTGGFGEELNLTFDNIGNLYLWGNTRGASGFATSNGSYPNPNNPQPNMTFGYLVKFSPKGGEEMGTSEVDIAKDLVLYDNPNNGNFTLSGNVLAQQNCKIKINDAAGRLITTQSLQKLKTQKINLQDYLAKGIYFINVVDEKEKSLKIFKMSVH